MKLQSAAGLLLRTLAVVVAGAFVGFALPYAWLRVGGTIQGSAGARPLAFVALVVTLGGIICSYAAILYVADRVAARRLPPETGRRPRQHSWNRTLGDHPQAPAQLNSLERSFATAAIAVTVAYVVWSLAFAGSSLPPPGGP